MKLGNQHLPCAVAHRKCDVVWVEFAEPVTIPVGRWAVLVAPGGRTRIAVELGHPSPPLKVKCYLLGELFPTPDVCLECGRVVSENEIVRRVAGMQKDSRRELCTKCWEAEATRLLRLEPPELEAKDDDDWNEERPPRRHLGRRAGDEDEDEDD